MKKNNCKDCLHILTSKEQYYYGDRCESCEVAWSESIQEWRSGGANEEFDKLYGSNPIKKH